MDADFREAMGGEWAALLRKAATELVAAKERARVLALAARCHQLDDAVLSRALLAVALDGVPVKDAEGLALHRAAIGWLQSTSQSEEADRLVSLLLVDGGNAKRADLWRIAASLADARERPARALECREKALALEQESPPAVIDLEQVRSDYSTLLGSYGKLAESLGTLKLAAPAGFRERVVAADRWRALDREQADACQLAARVLRSLGERELAFDYLTTPVGLRPGEADVWASMAATLGRQGERDLADRAYASAFDRESTNAQILWDRAENLRRAGRAAASAALFKQVADGDWQPRFATLKQQAKWQAGE